MPRTKPAGLLLWLLALPSCGATFTWSQPGLSLTTPLGNQFTLAPGSGSLTMNPSETQSVTIGTATIAYTGSGPESHIPASITYTVNNNEPCTDAMELSIRTAPPPTADFVPVAGSGCTAPIGTIGGIPLGTQVHTFFLFFGQNTVGGVPGNTGDVTASFSVIGIPEPSTVWLAGTGLLVFSRFRAELHASALRRTLRALWPLRLT